MQSLFTITCWVECSHCYSQVRKTNPMNFKAGNVLAMKPIWLSRFATTEEKKNLKCTLNYAKLYSVLSQWQQKLKEWQCTLQQMKIEKKSWLMTHFRSLDPFSQLYPEGHKKRKTKRSCLPSLMLESVLYQTLHSILKPWTWNDLC